MMKPVSVVPLSIVFRDVSFTCPITVKVPQKQFYVRLLPSFLKVSFYHIIRSYWS